MTIWPQKEKNEAHSVTLTVILIGLFLGLGIIIYFSDKTLIRIDTIFNIAIISAAVAFLIHFPFLKKLNRYLAEIIIYCLAGWGLILTALILALNFFIHAPGVQDVYKVVNTDTELNDAAVPVPASVQLEENDSQKHYVNADTYDDFQYLLKFSGEAEFKYKDKPRFAVITTAKGLFGYRVLIHKELR